MDVNNDGFDDVLATDISGGGDASVADGFRKRLSRGSP